MSDSIVVSASATKSAIQQAKEKDATEQNVIERLRASKTRTLAQAKEDGRESGADWAMYRAEYEELERLAGWDIGDEDDLSWEMLVVIAGGLGEARDNYDEFWEHEIDSREAPRNEFVEGFVEAAKEVFEEIDGKL